MKTWGKNGGKLLVFFALLVAALFIGSATSAFAADAPKTFYFHNTGSVVGVHFLSETPPVKANSQVTSVMSTSSPGFRLFHPGEVNVQHVFVDEPTHSPPSDSAYWVSNVPLSGTFSSGVWTFTIHKVDNIGGEFSKPHINVYSSPGNTSVAGATFLFHAEGPDWWNNNDEQIIFSITAAEAFQFDNRYLVVQLFDHCILDCNGGKTMVVFEDGLTAAVQTFIETPVFTAASIPDTVSPVVTLVSPAAGANVSGHVLVTADVVEENIASVTLRVLQAEAVVRELPMAAIAEAPSRFAVHVNTAFPAGSMPDGFYTFKVDALDASGNAGSASAPVTVDNTPPTVQVVEPLPFATISGEFAIKANASDALSGVKNVSYRITNSTIQAVGWTLLSQAEPGVWSGLQSPALLADGLYTVSVVARDFAGMINFDDVAIRINKSAPPAPSPEPTPEPSPPTPPPVGLSAVSPVHPVNGYPIWYQDGAGMAIEQCFEPNNPMCLADCAQDGVTCRDPDGNIIPFNQFSVDIGFGSEAFWWTTEGSMNINAPIPDAGASGKALMVLALEAAFANEDPARGDQMSFGRVRFFIDAPVAGRYKITYPFGVKEFEVLVPGPRAIKFTDDVGCVPVPAAGITCDFSLAFFSDIGPFLRWDTDFPVVGVDGRKYVGNPAVDHTITGSPLGTNFFRIEGPSGSNIGGPGVNTIETHLFSVSGRIADTLSPVVSIAEATPAVLEAGTGSATLQAHLTDDMSGIGAVTVDIGPITTSPNIVNMALQTGTVTDGIWSTVVSGITTLGSFTLPLTVVDRSGNPAVPASIVLTVVDTTAPVVALASDHAGSFVKDADTVLITATFTEAVAIDETSPPTISIGTVTNAAMTKVSNKVWTFSWDVPAGNELVSVGIAAVDTSGNPAAAATGQASFTIDNLAPSVATIASPATPVVVDSDTFTVSGTAEAGSTVVLKNSLGSVVASQQLGTGETAFGIAAPLTQNAFNSLAVTSVDAAGNEGVPAPVPTIIEDSKGVVVSLSYNPDRGVRDTDTLLVTATFDSVIPVDETPAKAPRVSIDYAGEGFDVLNAAMSKTGNLVWTYSANIPAGSDGTAVVTILAQNTNNDLNHPASNEQFMVDNTPPAAPVVATPSGATAVNLAAFNITGTAEAGSLVKVYNGTMVVGSQQLAIGVVDYSIAVPLVQNAVNLFNVTATDAAGNEGPVAAVPAITEDSVSPVISAVAASSITDSSATIAWSTDELSDSTVFYGITSAIALNVSVAAPVASHSIAIGSLSASTLYFFSVASCDAAGNCNTSALLNFTTSAPPSPPSSGSSGGGGSGGGSGGGGGGGGGGSAAAALSSETVSVTSQAGVESSFSFDQDDLGVYEIRVTGEAENSVSGMRVAEVKPAASMPKPIAKASGTIYKYLSITKQGTSSVAKASIGFKVEKSWFASNSLDPARVSLHRFNSGAWSALPTSKASEDGSYYYYEAVTPGFSIFAITSAVAQPKPVVLVPVAAPVVNVSNATTAAVPSAGLPITGSIVSESPAKANPLVGLLIILALVVAGIFGWKRYRAARRWKPLTVRYVPVRSVAHH